ncbi:MAG TPA: ABC transporter permease [Fimbriimonadaceae bacterium]|nr:ABC transporter permease [Fimbriimonadaceae bacterium]
MRRTLLNMRSAVVSLREQWQRSVLSALGIMVGSVAIVLLVSIAKGVQADITGQVRDIGVNILIVIPGRIDPSGFSPNLAGQSFLRKQDADDLAQVPGVVRTAPWTFVGGGIRNGDKTATTVLVATTPSWFQMHPTHLQEGRLIDSDNETENVCILGSLAKTQLFGADEAMNKTVQINARPYRVIGVTQDKRSEQSLFSMGSFQNVVYIPYPYLAKTEPGIQTHRIMIQTQPDAEPKALIMKLEAVLGKHLDRQQFQVITEEDLLGLVYKLMGILTWLLTGLTSIGLFVGGVGIMTVMLMSVNERSKEIGIRKTTGAKPSDIFAQFLSEAVTLAVSGGLVGLVFSYFVCLALTVWTPIKPMITFPIVALAFGVCIAVGGFFGLVPAMKASRKDPVEALRNE